MQQREYNRLREVLHGADGSMGMRVRGASEPSRAALKDQAIPTLGRVRFVQSRMQFGRTRKREHSCAVA